MMVLHFVIDAGENYMKKAKKHPIQPIELVDGIIRFKPNKIIQYLFHVGKLNLNEIAAMEFDKDDRQQLAQLLGYSICGYADLSYVDNKAWDRFMHKRCEEYDREVSEES